VAHGSPTERPVILSPGDVFSEEIQTQARQVHRSWGKELFHNIFEFGSRIYMIAHEFCSSKLQ
jgi:hypothetical protein